MSAKNLPWQRTFQKWLSDKNLTVAAGARELGIPLSLGYQYRDGLSTPGIDRVDQFCAPMGIKEAEFISILLEDSKARGRNRRNGRTTRAIAKV